MDAAKIRYVLLVIVLVLLIVLLGIWHDVADMVRGEGEHTHDDAKSYTAEHIKASAAETNSITTITIQAAQPL